MKMFLVSLLLGVQSLANASHLPELGNYGTYRRGYCGFELIRDVRNQSDIILRLIKNPTYNDSWCKVDGRLDLYKYNSEKNYFVSENSRSTCYLKAVRTPRELHIACYTKDNRGGNTIGSFVPFYKYPQEEDSK